MSSAVCNANPRVPDAVLRAHAKLLRVKLLLVYLWAHRRLEIRVILRGFEVEWYCKTMRGAFGLVFWLLFLCKRACCF